MSPKAPPAARRDPGGAAALRLDAALVARGLLPTRSRARDAILRGTVTVNGTVVARPAQAVGLSAAIALDDPAARWVSRGALKLLAGLDHFGYDPGGRTALDVGASTGGFTDVLLAGGATRVFAIDVGHGQLHPRLAGDPRVVLREGVNARSLRREDLGPEATDAEIGAIAIDVSFIPLRLVLPAVLALAAPGAFLVALVKPQFELGPAALGHGGIIRAGDAGPSAARAVAGLVAAIPGWQVDGVVPSPVAGGDGNREMLLGARLAPGAALASGALA